MSGEAVQKTVPRLIGKLGKSGLEAVSGTNTDELVIALCGPIGSGHREVAKEIKSQLSDSFGYEAKIIKLSKLIEEKSGTPPEGSAFKRIKHLQDKGNLLRQENGTEYLAKLSIEQISIEREEFKEKNSDTAYRSRRVCYIIDSFKNKDEYNLFFNLYREMFYCFGLYSPLKNRESELRLRNMSVSEVYEIIDRDSGEEIGYGQQVRDTFEMADFFIRVDKKDHSALRNLVERYLDLIFGTKIVTPTRAETAMHHAWVAAGNSACLSRQVGAALTDRDGNLVSVGWNDVPKFGGGLYQEDDAEALRSKPSPDMRCYNNGQKCYNDEEKSLLVKEIFSKLVENKLIESGSFLEFISCLQKSRVKGLIEFSRSIHAEMHAILNAIRAEGSRVQDGVLYVTTYPCHSCARHIIACGISEVYYIEPYRKSLAVRLHDDAVSEDENDTRKVKILPYDGVSPRKYLDLFSGMASRRKGDDGQLLKHDRKTANPILTESTEGFPVKESLVVATIDDQMPGQTSDD